MTDLALFNLVFPWLLFSAELLQMASYGVLWLPERKGEKSDE